MRGGQYAIGSAALLLTGCAASSGELSVRAVEGPLAAAAKRGTPMMAEARSMLALGNTGLALEAFRKVLRDEPNSVEALAGIAGCYEQMGRFDLARAKYEAALAVAPDDVVLLNTFAASLERQGKFDQARSLRAEAALAEKVEVAELTRSPAAQAAAPVAVPQAIARTAPAISVPVPPPVIAVPVAPAVPVKAAPLQPQVASITVPLPPARPAATPVARQAESAPTLHEGPRLERLSMGEVALVTNGGPLWRTELVAQTQQSVTVRFVALRSAESRPSVRLLNAARYEGLAARTRQALFGRGWRSIEIGDAPKVVASSVVIYPASRATLGRSLARQFNFRSELGKDGDAVVVLLGRDATRHRLIRPQA